ncbi:hypothetical protein GCM10017783_12400 [Deinococcus piscis]|uniref:SWIM-type domain-containing protein n=1 Tax=Deinococcus piscis TaxID=394230 RepID=A0ABQ3K680_9DEIO|nr:SWIM zinc finger family protein [Deinococcus piscis]GHG01674.1 hypothetical protein GCM10017783_12400 [Deinococcus piscis]
MSITPEAAAALAPDSASLKAAQKLATPGKWPTLSQVGGVLWGEAQGSGAHPYLVAADLRTSELATKCSCPSRKFPCKHALALLLLHASEAGDWKALAVPEELSKWLEGRQARAEKPKTEPKEADAAQHAKTWAKREKKMGAGLEALELWLTDLVREGLLAARGRPYSEWDAQAARLVDAQLPGVARLIRQIPGLLHEDSGEALTAHLGRLYLLTQAWQGREALSKGERADLLAVLGVPLDRAACQPAEGEEWLCVGSVMEEEGRLSVRRTWLLGRAGEVALLLDFFTKAAAQGQEFLPLHQLRGALAYAPAAFAQRAVFDLVEQLGPMPLPAHLALSLADLPAHWAAALALNPWLERTGVLLGPVYFAPGQLCSPEGSALPLADEIRGSYLWYLKAQANTELAYVFGEWNGETFYPLSLSPASEARP